LGDLGSFFRRTGNFSRMVRKMVIENHFPPRTIRRRGLVGSIKNVPDLQNLTYIYQMEGNDSEPNGPACKFACGCSGYDVWLTAEGPHRDSAQRTSGIERNCFGLQRRASDRVPTLELRGLKPTGSNRGRTLEAGTPHQRQHRDGRVVRSLSPGCRRRSVRLFGGSPGGSGSHHPSSRQCGVDSSQIALGSKGNCRFIPARPH
jgi:hypothetical protein